MWYSGRHHLFLCPGNSEKVTLKRDGGVIARLPLPQPPHNLYLISSFSFQQELNSGLELVKRPEFWGDMNQLVLYDLFLEYSKDFA